MATDIRINIGAKNAASKVLTKVSFDVKSLTRNLKKMSTAASSSLKGIGSSVGGMGRKFAVMGGAAVTGIGFAIKSFAVFDDRMAEVSALSGATGAALESLRTKAKDMGATTKFSASEAAEGMKFLGMAGFDTQEILSGIGPVLSLAAAGSLELGEAADIASDVSSAFGLSADEIGRVADVIAVTATSTNTSVAMMGETFAKVAPMAKAAGQSIEETSAAAGLLGNSGIKASVAGTDLQNALKALADTAQQTKLSSVGVEALDAEGNIRPMLDVMKELGTATKDMATGERLAFFSGVFGRSAKSAIILGDAGGAAIDKLRSKMINAEGSAAKMAETMQSGVGAAGTRIMSAFEGVQLAIGETIKKELLSISTGIAGFLGDVNKWIQTNPVLVKTLVAVTVGVTAFGITLIALGGFATAAGFAIGGLTAIVTTAVAIITTVFSPLGLVIGGVGLAVAGVTIALTAVAVSLGVAAHKSGAMSDIFKSATVILKKFREVAKKTFGAISDALSGNKWGLAAKIGWAGIRVAFFSGLEEISKGLDLAIPKMQKQIKSFLKWAASATIKTMKVIGKAVANPRQASGILNKVIKADFGKMTFIPTEGFAGFFKSHREAAERDLKSLSVTAKEVGDVVRLSVMAEPITTAIGAGLADALLDPLAAANKLADSLGSGLVSAFDALDSSSVVRIKIDPDQLNNIFQDTAGKISVKTVGSPDNPETRSLQATQGRLISRGVAENPNLVVAKEAKELLKEIDKNMKVTATAVSTRPPSVDSLSVEMVA